MTRVRRRRARLAATLLTTVLVTGCSAEVVDGRAVSRAGTSPGTGSPATSSPTTGTGTPGGTLTFGESAAAPVNLLPIITAGNTTATTDLVPRVLPSLYRNTPDVAYQADSAQGSASSAIVGGQQVVDISIDPRAAWADGTPITADDYEFTIDTQKSLDPARGGCAALFSITGFEQVARVTKLSSKRLKVYFATPYADWKGMFAGGITPLLSRHVLDAGSPAATCTRIARGWPVAGGIPLGAQNGPWLITGANVDTAAKTITLIPNPRYWGPKPQLSRLIYTSIGSDADTAAKALINGDVDVIYPQPQTAAAARLGSTSGIRAAVSFGAAFEHLDFNGRDALLKYPQVRQAIALAIDRRALVAGTVGRISSYAAPLGNRLLLSNQPGYADNSGEYATRNIARARQLLASVGAKAGGDGIMRLGGRPLSFRVTTTPDNPLRDATIAALAAQVKQIGVQLTEFANPDIFSPTKPTSLFNGGFQMALFAWVGTASVSSSTYAYQSTSPDNYGKIGTSAIDAQLRQTFTASSPSAQVAAANAADRLLWQQMATLPLYQKPTLLAYRDTVSGLVDNTTVVGPLWNSDSVSVR